MLEQFSIWAVHIISAFLLTSSLLSFSAKRGARPIEISYSLPAEQLSLHEPVVMTFSVRNATPADVHLDLGQDRKGGFLLSVTRPDGVKIELQPYSRDGISLAGRVSVGPGQSFTQNIVLNEWYDFQTPGRYLLEARLAEPISITDGSGSLADS
jgi:hypothetical protein